MDFSNLVVVDAGMNEEKARKGIGVRGAPRLNKPFQEIIKAALRVGVDEILAPPAAKASRTKPRPLGLRRGFSYDNISELLAASVGSDGRTP